MAFRKSISQDELREKLSDEEKANGPTYQSSRGGWYPEPSRPVPGTPKSSSTDAR